MTACTVILDHEISHLGAEVRERLKLPNVKIQLFCPDLSNIQWWSCSQMSGYYEYTLTHLFRRKILTNLNPTNGEGKSWLRRTSILTANKNGKPTGVSLAAIILILLRQWPIVCIKPTCVSQISLMPWAFPRKRDD